MINLLRSFKRPRSVRTYSADELKEHHAKGTTGEQAYHGGTGSEYIGDFVFGGIDGVVTTFAIMAGVAGADLSASIILVLGIANLLADGFAMGVGNFLSIRSEKERYEHERQEEEYEIATIPEHERAEIEAIYQAKGFSGEALQHAVAVITGDKDRWVREMLFEEHGLTPDTRSPLTGGIVTYVAFIVIGFIPLLSFVVALVYRPVGEIAFTASVVLTAAALFIIGALKTLVIPRSAWKAGFETLMMGGLAAVVAYTVGFFLRGLA